jgi:hypothetical protein
VSLIAVLQQTARSPDRLLWLSLLALVGLRFFLGSDLALRVVYSPHDDSLYVERAFHLLRGEAFGPYDGRVLVKYPGMSLWLAAMRLLRIPFLLSIEAAYLLAGAYLLIALRRCGVRQGVLIAAAALYLLNPMSFGVFWIRAIREPLETCLLAALLGAVVHIYAAAEQGRRGWLHLAILTVVFAFALFLREESRLLWLLLPLFLVFLVWQMARSGTLRSPAWHAFLAVAMVAPIGAAKIYESSLRAFVERNYGAPILHDLGEGEFARMMAALRSIRTREEHRLVMVPQEALVRLRTEVPAFAPVIDRLPPPGPDTYSCKLHGICGEWSNGWMHFWIKDAAYDAGLTPTLPAGQEYFRRIRLGIEQACARGGLECAARGEGLVPPPDLRWTSAYLEQLRSLAVMTLRPDPQIVVDSPLLVDTFPGLGRTFREVTLVDAFHARWLTSEVLDPEKPPRYINPAAAWRIRLVDPYQMLAAALLIAAGLLAGYRLWTSLRYPLRAHEAMAMVFALYLLLRLAALAYIVTFFGPFESRTLMPTYVVGVPLALVFVVEALRRRR